MTRLQESPNEWSDPPWCKYCKGGNLPPGRRVCDLCRASRGRTPVRTWLKRIGTSGLMIDHRLANDMGYPIERRPARGRSRC